jgi:hypothetical protein
MAEYRAAMEAGDIDAVARQLSPDVVLHSPLTARPFVGHAECVELLGALLETMDSLEYTHEFVAGDSFFLVFTASLEGREVQGCDLYELDSDGLISSQTVFARPLAGAAAFGPTVGPRLARRHARWRALVTRTLPLPQLLEAVDRLGTRIARPQAVGRKD